MKPWKVCFLLVLLTWPCTYLLADEAAYDKTLEELLDMEVSSLDPLLLLDDHNLDENNYGSSVEGDQISDFSEISD